VLAQVLQAGVTTTVVTAAALLPLAMAPVQAASAEEKVAPSAAWETVVAEVVPAAAAKRLRLAAASCPRPAYEAAATAVC
jgi:hypothetical protein